MWEKHISVFHHSSGLSVLYTFVVFAHRCLRLCPCWPVACSLFPQSWDELNKMKAVYRSFCKSFTERCTWDRAIALALIQTSSCFFFPLHHTVSSLIEKKKTQRKRTLCRTNSFWSGFTENEVEERRGFKVGGSKGKLRKKVTKQYRTVFMSAGFSKQPLLFSSTTGPKKKKHDQTTDTKITNRDSDQTSVQLLLQPSLLWAFVIFSNIHPSIHQSIHSSIHLVTV